MPVDDNRDAHGRHTSYRSCCRLIKTEKCFFLFCAFFSLAFLYEICFANLLSNEFHFFQNSTPFLNPHSKRVCVDDANARNMHPAMFNVHPFKTNSTLHNYNSLHTFFPRSLVFFAYELHSTCPQCRGFTLITFCVRLGDLFFHHT